ncbi:hypothetical protein ACWYRQ_12960 [Clostridioides difficile]
MPQVEWLFTFVNTSLHETYQLKEIKEDISKFVITPNKENTSTTNFYTKDKAMLLLERYLDTDLLYLDLVYALLKLEELGGVMLSLWKSNYE